MMQSCLITVCASLIERQRETVSPSRKETHKGASLGERVNALANTKRVLRQLMQGKEEEQWSCFVLFVTCQVIRDSVLYLP
jgi:hypothetical protein